MRTARVGFLAIVFLSRIRIKEDLTIRNEVLHTTFGVCTLNLTETGLSPITREKQLRLNHAPKALIHGFMSYRVANGHRQSLSLGSREERRSQLMP